MWDQDTLYFTVTLQLSFGMLRSVTSVYHLVYVHTAMELDIAVVVQVCKQLVHIVQQQQSTVWRMHMCN